MHGWPMQALKLSIWALVYPRTVQQGFQAVQDMGKMHLVDCTYEFMDGLCRP